MVELTFDPEERTYCVYMGIEPMLVTTSYDRALKRFNELCEQVML